MVVFIAGVCVHKHEDILPATANLNFESHAQMLVILPVLEKCIYQYWALILSVFRNQCIHVHFHISGWIP